MTEEDIKRVFREVLLEPEFLSRLATGLMTAPISLEHPEQYGGYGATSDGVYRTELSAEDTAKLGPLAVPPDKE